MAAATAAAIGKGGSDDCSCRGIPFIQEGDGEGEGESERERRYRDAGMHCIVPNRTKYRTAGRRRAERAGRTRPSVRQSIHPSARARVSERRRLLAVRPSVRPSVPTLTGNTRWRKLSGDSDRAVRRKSDRMREAATAFEEREWRLTRGISLSLSLSLFAVFYCLQRFKEQISPCARRAGFVSGYSSRQLICFRASLTSPLFLLANFSFAKVSS